MSWNLPPGVRECDIPGNRPEDEAWDAFYEFCEREGMEVPDDYQERGKLFQWWLNYIDERR